MIEEQKMNENASHVKATQTYITIIHNLSYGKREVLTHHRKLVALKARIKPEGAVLWNIINVMDDHIVYIEYLPKHDDQTISERSDYIILLVTSPEKDDVLCCVQEKLSLVCMIDIGRKAMFGAVESVSLEIKYEKNGQLVKFPAHFLQHSSIKDFYNGDFMLHTIDRKTCLCPVMKLFMQKKHIVNVEQ